MNSKLLKDLEISAKKRSVSVDLLIEQILSTAMLHEEYLTDKDNDAIKAIYKKYIN